MTSINSAVINKSPPVQTPIEDPNLQNSAGNGCLAGAEKTAQVADSHFQQLSTANNLSLQINVPQISPTPASATQTEQIGLGRSSPISRDEFDDWFKEISRDQETGERHRSEVEKTAQRANLSFQQLSTANNPPLQINDSQISSNSASAIQTEQSSSECDSSSEERIDEWFREWSENQEARDRGLEIGLPESSDPTLSVRKRGALVGKMSSDNCSSDTPFSDLCLDESSKLPSLEELYLTAKKQAGRHLLKKKSKDENIAIFRIFWKSFIDQPSLARKERMALLENKISEFDLYEWLVKLGISTDHWWIKLTKRFREAPASIIASGEQRKKLLTENEKDETIRKLGLRKKIQELYHEVNKDGIDSNTPIFTIRLGVVA